MQRQTTRNHDHNPQTAIRPPHEEREATMKRHHATTAAIMAATTILIFGANNARAEDFSRADVTTTFLTEAKTCPGNTCKTQAQADRLTALCPKALRQCSTAWAFDDPERGPKCATVVKAVGCNFKAVAGGKPVTPTPEITDATKPQKQGVATDLCKDFACQADGVCRTDKVDGKKTPICHCPDGTFGTHCEKQCAPPTQVTTYVCPVLVDNTGKIEWQNSATPCDTTTIGAVVTNLKKASGAGWWWWLIIILSLIIVGLLIALRKLKFEKDELSLFLQTSGQDPKKVLLQARARIAQEKENTQRMPPPQTR